MRPMFKKFPGETSTSFRWPAFLNIFSPKEGTKATPLPKKNTSRGLVVGIVCQKWNNKRELREVRSRSIVAILVEPNHKSVSDQEY